MNRLSPEQSEPMHPDAGNGKLLVVVGADQDEVQDLSRRLHRYRCIAKDIHEIQRRPDELEVASADAVMVWAGKHNENEAEKTCQALREQEALARTPVLAAITMFQIVVGNQVKKIPGAHYVFTPVEEAALDERLTLISEELE